MNLSRHVRRPSPTALVAAVALSVVLGASGCGAGTAGGQSSDGGDSSNSDSNDNTAADSGRQEFVVLAESSLSAVFDDLADTFEAEHAGVAVVADYGSSTDLVEQVAAGAPGDVLATADRASMTVAKSEVAGKAQVFATSELVIVVPTDNPGDVETLDDLEGTSWVRCADAAACGRAARALLGDNGVDAEPVSLEEDTRAVLETVESGEAEAGLVSASDVLASDAGVESIEIPGAEDQETSYVVTPLRRGTDPQLAADWAEMLLSEEGRSALEDAGFTLP